MNLVQDLIQEDSKICSKCGHVKPINEFHKQKSGKYGVKSYCKSCAGIYAVRYNKENINSVKEYRKSWRLKNKEHIKELNRALYYKNKDSVNSRSLEWFKKNRDKAYDSHKKYRAKLSDRYVYNIMKISIPPEYITPELIELKRHIIKTKRVIKSKKQ